MARLTLGQVRDIAKRRRPWTIRLECVDLSTNTSKFWFATGRAMDEMVECGWGRIGSKPQLKLIPYHTFDDKVDEKLAKGYDYANTPYVRMSPGNLAKLTATPPQTPAPQVTPQPTPAALSTPTTSAQVVNPSLPMPFNLIRWLKPKKNGFTALDTNEQALLDVPLAGGKSLLRDFSNTIHILA